MLLYLTNGAGQSTGLGRSTITGIISTLLGEGLIQETGSASTPSGRKPGITNLCGPGTVRHRREAGTNPSHHRAGRHEHRGA
jgi:hypothetical protein